MKPKNNMIQYFENIARALLGMKYGDLSEEEREVIERIARREPVAENINITFHESLTFGQRMADRVAAFGGSWSFILLFTGIMVAWMLLNSYVLIDDKAFDPYPYILLNLTLSSLAALQAPIIMMSQNRQAAKDRLDISADYQVNLKAELEIMRLHEKIDDLTQLLLAQKSKEL
ncbi:MAG: DUF1003 domain-containing protein [Porticoccaceae bacterium]|nr:DUF1003 domain-containing protein [Porticoccaceae bacterium]